MRAVVQRVTKSSVVADQEITGQINRGLMVLLGINSRDSEKDCAYMADKISGLSGGLPSLCWSGGRPYNFGNNLIE